MVLRVRRIVLHEIDRTQAPSTSAQTQSCPKGNRPVPCIEQEQQPFSHTWFLERYPRHSSGCLLHLHCYRPLDLLLQKYWIQIHQSLLHFPLSQLYVQMSPKLVLGLKFELGGVSLARPLSQMFSHLQKVPALSLFRTYASALVCTYEPLHVLHGQCSLPIRF